MKKIVLFLSLLISFGFGSVMGQVCDPDTATYSQPGVWPTALEDVCPFENYAQVITLIVPADCMGFTLDSLLITGITGTPASYNYQCNPPSCTFIGDSVGCVLLTGSPTLADTGISPVSVAVEIHTPIIDLPTTLDSFKVVVNNPPKLTPGAVPTSCVADDGIAYVSATGAGPFDYLWNTSPPQTTDSIMGLPVGVYQVVVTDTNNCVDSATASVVTSTGPTEDSTSATMLDCYGDSDGEAVVFLQGGTPPFTYSWDNGGTDSSTTGLEAGNHCVSITDAALCDLVICVDITGPDSIEMNFTVQDASCNGDGDGEVTVSSSGGSGPHGHLWNNGSASTTISNLAAGNYCVTVTDSLGCMASSCVDVNEPDVLSVTMAFTDESCDSCNDGTGMATPAGGTSPYSYAWSNSETGGSVSGLAPGSYSVTVTDANDCEVVDSITIAVFVGIVEGFDNSFDARIYPNPTSTAFNLEISYAQHEDFEVAVLDLQGRTVYAEDLGRSNKIRKTIDLGSIGKGMYFVKVAAGDKSYTEKLMVR